MDKKKLILLGTAESVFEVPYEDPSYEIWATGTAFGAYCADIKRVDLGFEIHPIDVMLGESSKKEIDYNKFNCPIMVQDPENPITKQLIKNPILFPKDEVIAFGERKFYTSTFCWMLVYAVMMGYRELYFKKILLTSGGEYFLERPGIEYWIETLKLKYDIKVYWEEDCELFADCELYGYQQRANIYKTRSFQKHLWSQMHNEIGLLEQLTARINKNMGALECLAMMRSKEKPTEEQLLELITNTNTQVMADKKMAKDHKEKYLQLFGGLQMLSYLEGRGM